MLEDYYELDFLDVETKSSGDAISVRYRIGGVTTIHVVDAGFADTGEKMVDHINKHYGNPDRIDHVVVTHGDQDHASGIPTVLESFDIGVVWMLRPWMYAAELLPRFPTYTSESALRAKLRSLYPYLAAVEDTANELGIAIEEPFQGRQIGAFTVLTPTRQRYLDLIVDSDRTPQSKASESNFLGGILAGGVAILEKAATLIKSAWGVEIFPKSGTSRENEMSVVQYAQIADRRIVLTGDSGREGLAEAAAFAPVAGLQLPGVSHFQLPHHGGRHNVDTATLDKWLGPILETQPATGSYTAIISSAKDDKDHPRKAVVRAAIHRGADVITTEGRSIRSYSTNAPARDGYSPVTPEAYPGEQEED